MKKGSNATGSSITADSRRFIKQMDAAQTNEELAKVIRAERRRLEAKYPVAAGS